MALTEELLASTTGLCCVLPDGDEKASASLRCVSNMEQFQILCCWSVNSHKGAQEKANQTNSMHDLHVCSRERGKSATSAPYSTQTGKEDASKSLYDQPVYILQPTEAIFDALVGEGLQRHDLDEFSPRHFQS